MVPGTHCLIGRSTVEKDAGEHDANDCCCGDFFAGKIALGVACEQGPKKGGVELGATGSALGANQQKTMPSCFAAALVAPDQTVGRHKEQQ